MDYVLMEILKPAMYYFMLVLGIFFTGAGVIGLSENTKAALGGLVLGVGSIAIAIMYGLHLRYEGVWEWTRMWDSIHCMLHDNQGYGSTRACADYRGIFH